MLFVASKTNEDEEEQEDSEAEVNPSKDKRTKQKAPDGNPALHWLFRKIAYIARKPGNDERVTT